MYEATIFDAAAESASFKIAGTLDGELDFAMQPKGSRSRTVQLSILEALTLAVALQGAILDLVANGPEAAP